MKRLFVTGIPVTGKDLVGRQEELKKIKYLLQNGQSVVLIAPRRFGKTSLVLTVLEKLRKNGDYVADIDLFTIINKRRLAENIVEKVLENKKVKKVITRIKKGISDAFKNVTIKQIIEDYEFVLKFNEPQMDTNKLLEEALDFPEKFAKKERRALYFFYDEFGDVAKLDGGKIVKLMRAKFQRHSNITYIFAGSHESLMRELFTKEKSAFYKFATVVYLEEIGTSDFLDYIKRKFKEEGIFIADSAVKEILKRTRCHPYYTQLVCSAIHYLVKGKKSVIEIGDIKNGYEEAFISERIYLEKVWEELTPTQIEVLLRIVLSLNLYSNKSNTNVARTLKSLLIKGIIKRKSKGKYAIIDPFLEEFLRRNQ